MPQESIEDAIQALDPTPWVLALTPSDRAVYGRMAEAESMYVDTLEQAGCPVIRPNRSKSSRRALVVVLPDVKLPDSADLIARVSEWQDLIKTAVEEQDKEDTTGIRGATLPVWLGVDGRDHPFSEPRPDYSAKHVRHHQQRAYRGVTLTPEAALDILHAKRRRTALALNHSIDASKKARIANQQSRIEQLDTGIGQLADFIREGIAVSVRLHSGLSWRVSVRTTDKRSFASTIATVALVPGTRETLIAPAYHRRQVTDDNIETVLLPGNLELRVRRRG
jgi:hypothetical protein